MRRINRVAGAGEAIPIFLYVMYPSMGFLYTPVSTLFGNSFSRRLLKRLFGGLVILFGCGTEAYLFLLIALNISAFPALSSSLSAGIIPCAATKASFGTVQCPRGHLKTLINHKGMSPPPSRRHGGWSELRGKKVIAEHPDLRGMMSGPS